MALKIIDDECRIEEGKLVVVVEGKDPEEVLSVTARNMAIAKAASCGYTRVGINGSSGSYPVDSNGQSNDDWNVLAKEKGIAAYRNELKLMSSY